MRSVVLRSWVKGKGLAMAMAMASVAAGCSASSGPKDVGSNDPLAGVTGESLLALSNTPQFTGSSGTLAVTVAVGEVAVISMRAADSAIEVNGQLFVDSSVPAKPVKATSATVKTITITEDMAHAGSKEVVIDYTNGLFATGTSSAGTGITVDLNHSASTTALNTLAIKGTSKADKVVFGANGVNMNGDAHIDVSWQAAGSNGGAATFIASLGAGDDTWSALGDSATGGVFNNNTPINSGTNNGVTVYGGPGNDTFLEGDGSVLSQWETIYGGGQAKDTVDYSLRTNPVQVTVGANASDDGDWTAGSPGSTNEHDSIQSDVLVVNGGSANDILVQCKSAGGVDYPVTFNGNGGDDSFTPYGGKYVMNGGAGNDTFVMGAETDTHGPGTLNGGVGTDLVDFSARTSTVSVKMDGKTASGTAAGSPLVVSEGMFVGTDVENIYGGSGNDVITGNDSDNVIVGYQGNDILSGGLGDDRFDESISAAALALMTPATDSGSDTISGGGGVDTVDYSSRTVAVWAALDGTNDSGTATFTQTLSMSSPYTDGTCALTSSSEQDTINTDVENIWGGSGDDCLFGQPNSLTPTDGEPTRMAVTDCTKVNCQNELVGNDGNDMLFGLDDDDVLQGGNPPDMGYSTEVDALDCGNGQGNLGFDVGGGMGAYKAANCQL